ADRRNRQSPGNDRDKDRGDVGGAQTPVGQAYQDREPGRSVRNYRRVEARPSARRVDPETGECVDSFVEVDESQSPERPQTEQAPDSGQCRHNPHLAVQKRIASRRLDSHAGRFYRPAMHWANSTGPGARPNSVDGVSRGTGVRTGRTPSSGGSNQPPPYP